MIPFQFIGEAAALAVCLLMGYGCFQDLVIAHCAARILGLHLAFLYDVIICSERYLEKRPVGSIVFLFFWFSEGSTNQIP